MITIRFKRTDDGIFVPHTDVLRNLNRVFRRAGIAVEYSKGFNRHMSLKMTQPLPLGTVDGDCYVTADAITTLTACEAVELFNNNCPPYLKATAAYITDRNPNLAGIINASRYVVLGKLSEKQIRSINSLTKHKYIISVKTKSGTEDKDVGNLIYGIKADANGICATLAFGNTNLRIDKLCESFNVNFGTELNVTDCIRTEQLIIGNGKMVSVSDYMEEICSESYISK